MRVYSDVRGGRTFQIIGEIFFLKPYICIVFIQLRLTIPSVMDSTTTSDCHFDDTFSQISTLNSLPWVGKNYCNGKRLLIIGESHYHWVNDEEDSKVDYDERIMTRGFIQWNITDNINGTDNPFMRNIERALAWDDCPCNEDKIKLWTTTAFMNFSQRIMENIEDRPTYGDYSNGWDNFLKVVNAIAPDYCLIFTLGTANHDENDVDAKLEANGYQSGKYELLSQIGRDRVWKLNITKDDRHIPIIFVRHPSAFFAWTDYAQLIHREYADYFSWLWRNDNAGEHHNAPI
jgi:hypothetical protein